MAQSHLWLSTAPVLPAFSSATQEKPTVHRSIAPVLPAVSSATQENPTTHRSTAPVLPADSSATQETPTASSSASVFTYLDLEFSAWLASIPTLLLASPAFLGFLCVCVVPSVGYCQFAFHLFFFSFRASDCLFALSVVLGGLLPTYIEAEFRA